MLVVPVWRFHMYAAGFSRGLLYNVKKVWEESCHVECTEIVAEDKCSDLLAVGRGRTVPYELYH